MLPKYIKLSFWVILLAFGAKAQIITTVVGNGIAGNGGDGGPVTAASINKPAGIAFDAAGNMFIAEVMGFCIRKVSTSGIITTAAGRGTSLAYNGGPATAAYITHPQDIVFDKAGNYYITCENLVLKIDIAGNIFKIAGSLANGYSGDGGPATNALLYGPTGITLDSSGNIYFADIGNHVVRKIDSSGIITTFAGTGFGAGTGIGGFSGDGGPATSARLSRPCYLVFDRFSNLLISDWLNNRVRKVSSSGIITTIAGGGTGWSSGPATAASVYAPMGLALDFEGNLYIALHYNNLIWKVNSLGNIEICAGTGIAGFSGDGGYATAAELDGPTDLFFDAGFNLFIADRSNNRIRKVSSTLGVENLTHKKSNVKLLPNPNNGTFTLCGTINTYEKIFIEVENILGQFVYESELMVTQGKINTEIHLDRNLPNGLYLIHLKGKYENEVLRFVVDK